MARQRLLKWENPNRRHHRLFRGKEAPPAGKKSGARRPSRERSRLRRSSGGSSMLAVLTRLTSPGSTALHGRASRRSSSCCVCTTASSTSSGTFPPDPTPDFTPRGVCARCCCSTPRHSYKRRPRCYPALRPRRRGCAEGRTRPQGRRLRVRPAQRWLDAHEAAGSRVVRDLKEVEILSAHTLAIAGDLPHDLQLVTLGRLHSEDDPAQR